MCYTYDLKIGDLFFYSFFLFSLFSLNVPYFGIDKMQNLGVISRRITVYMIICEYYSILNSELGMRVIVDVKDYTAWYLN